MAQRVKPLPAMRETWVQFLGHEDSLENKMATHSSILAWRIRWTKEPDPSPWGSQKVRHNLATKHHHHRVETEVQAGQTKDRQGEEAEGLARHPPPPS